MLCLKDFHFYQVLLALSCRVDVISSNLASLSTQKGLALCFTSPNNEYSGDDSVVGEKRQAENVQGQRNKRVKLDNSIANAIAAKDTEEDVDSFGVINDATNSSSAFTRNLWDKKYREDKKPLVSSNGCW